MKVGSPSGNEKTYSAVVEHFPHRELAIRRLLQSDEVFREMCEELSDAKLALANYTHPQDAVLEARRNEWRELIGRLVAELMAVLIAYDAGLRRDHL